MHEEFIILATFTLIKSFAGRINPGDAVIIIAAASLLFLVEQ